MASSVKNSSKSAKSIASPGSPVPAEPAAQVGQSRVFALKYLGRVTEWTATFIHDGLTAAGYSMLGPSHWEMITYIGRKGPLTPAAIAQGIHRDRSTITALLKKLEELQLILRKPNPDDGRSYFIALSAKGKRLHPKMVGLFAALRAEVHGALSKDEAVQLNALLKKVYEAKVRKMQ